MGVDKQFQQLQKRIGVKFKNQDLLHQALVHRSYLNENPSFHLGHNERLEYLGDAVLELVVTDFLFANFPRATEGDMTSWRASLVNSKMLASISRQLDVEPLLYLSKGESKDTSSKARSYILTNALEALIGAMYLDRGYKTAEKFIQKFILVQLPHILAQRLDVDPKSKFQELAQEKLRVTPRYDVLEEKGPDHAKWFRVGVFLGDDLVASGEGSSKQEAQMDAARKGLQAKDWHEE